MSQGFEQGRCAGDRLQVPTNSVSPARARMTFLALATGPSWWPGSV